MKSEGKIQAAIGRLSCLGGANMIARFEDDIYPKADITHIRHTARAFIVDEDNHYLFLHIRGEDEFGVRNHLETVGGGIEQGETAEEAVLREISEEAGFDSAEIICDLGIIEDTYNLIHRKTLSHFFAAKVKRSEQGKNHPTKSELTLFDDMVWIPQTQVESVLSDPRYRHMVGELVHRRDLCAFRFYQALLKEKKKD